MKLTSQAMNVLKMLFKYFIKKEYITEDLRDKKIEEYGFEEINDEA